jgi:predicted Fe-Mo cluster-binding NifX family protein
MKIAVTATEPSLDGAVDPRFGRCPYFVIVETDDLAFEAVDNPNVTLGGGAGIQSAQLMNEKGVRFVLTGNCGPNAYRTLSAAGIEVIVGCSGLVRDVVEQFKAGRLDAADEPNVVGRFGMGNPSPDDQVASSQQSPAMETAQQPPVSGMGMGRGGGRRGGMGKGMGRGGGRGGGMGRGMGGVGMGAGAWPPAPIPKTILQPPQSAGKQEQLTLLKQQAEALGEQMQEIQERIRQLEEEEGA